MKNNPETSQSKRTRLIFGVVMLAGLAFWFLLWLAAPTATGRAPSAIRQVPPELFVAVYNGPRASIQIPVIRETLPGPTRPPRASGPGKAPLPIVVEKEAPPVARNGVGELRGRASWYCLPGVSACMAVHPTGGMYAAAGPSLRSAIGPNWRGQTVRVCSGGSCVSVVLADWCACGAGYAIDLYSDAFRQLGPLSAGVIPVTVHW